MGIIYEMNELVNGDSAERNRKEQEYLDYIKEHVHNVVSMYEKYFFPLLYKDFALTTCSASELKASIEQIKEYIQFHDSSKYSEEEFVPYRRKFYPTSAEQALDAEQKRQIEDESEEAWVHHYRNNPHHPQYWKDENGTRDMHMTAIVEMLCDWMAMSYKFHQDTLEWWNKAEKEKSFMTEKTKEIVDEILNFVLR